MPADRDDRAGQQGVRKSVVPEAAGRSLWLAAVWTGVGAAVACATVAIIIVAILWLPVSGDGTHATSAIRAGLLSFLAALHGGVRVDGGTASWLPLGMTIAVGVTLWRAGSGLADAAAALDERAPARLWLAGAAQAATFTLCCLVAVPFATLGTSSVPLLGVGVGALTLFAVSGLVAFVRASDLRAWCAERIPRGAGLVARAGVAAVAIYLASGALLVAAAVAIQHTRVETISGQVGGGWGGVPILLLGVLAAPNAMIAATSYLAGPGFAVGSGTSFGLGATTHGTVPAFPLLGALPSGPGSPAAWALAVATPVVAGAAVARLSARAPGWCARLLLAVSAAVAAGLAMLVLAWQGGGAVGGGRLHVVGASPWQLGGVVALGVGATSLVWLGVGAAWVWLRRPVDDQDEVGFFLTPAKRTLVSVPDDGDAPGTGKPDDDSGAGKLAG